MISVAMTSYNGEKYIIKQLQSIRCQSMPIDEVIICDDGSVDSTVEIVESYIRQNHLSSWRLIQNEENLKYSKNFFKAVSLCKGDYIFLADQDDIWVPDKVRLMTEILEKDPYIMAVSSNYVVVDQNDSKKYQVNLTAKNRFVCVDEMVGSSNIKGCTMCIRKELDDYIPHYDIEVGKQLGHDWYYNFLACLIGKNEMLSDALLCYRIHGDNISLKREKRKTALALSKEKRIEIFDEAIMVTAQVICRCEQVSTLDPGKKRNINKMIAFCKRRRSFINGNYMQGIVLLAQYRNYRRVSINFKQAFHTMLSDFMYAFQINWKL